MEEKKKYWEYWSLTDFVSFTIIVVLVGWLALILLSALAWLICRSQTYPFVIGILNSWGYYVVFLASLIIIVGLIAKNAQIQNSSEIKENGM